VRGEAIAGTAHLEQYHCPCNSIVEVFYYQYYKLQIPVSQIALDKRKSVCIAFRRAQRTVSCVPQDSEGLGMFTQLIASDRPVRHAGQQALMKREALSLRTIVSLLAVNRADYSILLSGPARSGPRDFTHRRGHREFLSRAIERDASLGLYSGNASMSLTPLRCQFRRRRALNCSRFPHKAHIHQESVSVRSLGLRTICTCPLCR
jgi:hypothetical protein